MPWVDDAIWSALINQNRRVLVSLARIESRLNLISNQETAIMADLSKLQADVAAETSVTQSAITLLQGLKAQLDAAGTDPQKLADLSTQLEASTKALSDAVAANTPAAPSA